MTKLLHQQRQQQHPHLLREAYTMNNKATALKLLFFCSFSKHNNIGNKNICSFLCPHVL